MNWLYWERGGSNKGLFSLLMLLAKQVSIWCHFTMRILCYLSHRSFFELTLDPINLWDMEEVSSCQSGEWWHF